MKSFFSLYKDLPINYNHSMPGCQKTFDQKKTVLGMKEKETGAELKNVQQRHTIGAAHTPERIF